MDAKKMKVLLIGNGILQSFGGESWKSFLSSIKKRNDLPSYDEINCPEPLKAVLLTGDKVDVAMREKCNKMLSTEYIDSNLVKILREILSFGFDHILTTNYTYELEQAAVNPKKLTKNGLKKMATSTKSRVENKYLIHTYNRTVCNGIENKVWHIHGEARKPDSTILGHYYYGNYLFKIRKEIEKIPRVNLDAAREAQSWVEAFLLGDIYCVGFGFNFSEFDLWWLLNRKTREKRNSGKLYFYEPMDDSQWEKVSLLQLFKMPSGEKLVEIVHLNCIKDNNMDWKQFYAKAIADIQKR